jgi:hypothetical protein
MARKSCWPHHSGYCILNIGFVQQIRLNIVACVRCHLANIKLETALSVVLYVCEYLKPCNQLTTEVIHEVIHALSTFGCTMMRYLRPLRPLCPNKVR